MRRLATTLLALASCYRGDAPVAPLAPAAPTVATKRPAREVVGVWSRATGDRRGESYRLVLFESGIFHYKHTGPEIIHLPEDLIGYAYGRWSLERDGRFEIEIANMSPDRIAWPFGHHMVARVHDGALLIEAERVLDRWQRVPHPYGVGPAATERAAQDEYLWRTKVHDAEAKERRHYHHRDDEPKE